MSKKTSLKDIDQIINDLKSLKIKLRKEFKQQYDKAWNIGIKEN